MRTDQLGRRLKEALQLRGRRQQELAAAIGQSESAVSHYISGKKKMSLSTAARIAEELACSVDWLTLGKGPAPTWDAGAAALQPLQWRMRRGYADGAKDLSNPAWLVFPASIRAIVREMLQNAGDASVDGESVRAVIRLHSLSGETLDAFRTALCWDQIEPHVRAGAEQDKTLGRTLKRGLRMLENGPLLIATFNDYGTTGLIGSEFGSDDPTSSNRENFSALVRHTADTQKSSSSAGGSYGVGKNAAVLGSAIRTALYNSTLIEAVSGKRLNRLIGRTDLGWRLVKGEDYAGPGWFGLSEGASKVVSSWDDRARVRDLLLERSEDANGTSVLIPAFHDPSGATASIEDLSKQILTAVAEDFWPAIVRKQLEVSVETFDNRDLTSAVVVEPETYRSHAVAMIKAFENGTTTDAFNTEGDVVSRKIQIAVPKRTDEDGIVLRPAADHEAVLLIARADLRDQGGDINRVAAFRAPGMVVEERPYANVGLTDVKFRAVLMVGIAAQESPEGEIAELFFKSAEPPAHDKWSPQAISLNQYYYGGQKRLKDLQKAIGEALRDALSTARASGKDGPDAIYRHFLIPGGVGDPPAPTPPAPQSVRLKDMKWVTQRGKNLIRITLRVPAGDHRFRITPALACRYEDGSGVRVPIARLSEFENCTQRPEGDIVTEPGRPTAIFHIEPDWSGAELERRYTVLSFDIAAQAKEHS